jgi:hypothetical protein
MTVAIVTPTNKTAAARNTVFMQNPPIKLAARICEARALANQLTQP